MGGRRGATLALGVALAFVARPAHAESAVELAWSAPPECPQRAEVLAEVRRLAGERAEGPRSLVARGAITRAKTYVLDLVVASNGDDRARVVEAASCDELADAAALVLVLALGSETRREPPPARASLVPVPVVFPKPAPSRDAREPEREPSSHLDTFALLATRAGTFRDPALESRLGVAWSSAPFRVALDGFFAWGGDVAPETGGSAGARFWLAGGSASACLERAAGSGPLGGSAGACLGLEAGALTAEAYGVRFPTEKTAAWLAPLAGVAARWPARSPLALRFDAAAMLPLIRADFILTGVGFVHRAAPIGARGGLGLELRVGSF